ncbi:hypothetical protein GCM10020229_12520 [Kitasatospora albolonga]|uniref:hypothetical protein n=1 Tax=Kitasatospora albolonga TaxID=68173 RepID=UPI0031E937EF
MLDSDPPDHTRLRRLVGRAFTARRVESLRPRITALVDELLDGLAGQDRVELMEALAFPVPFNGDLLAARGAPDDRAEFRRWSNLLVSGARRTEEVRDANVAMIGYPPGADRGQARGARRRPAERSGARRGGGRAAGGRGAGPDGLPAARRRARDHRQPDRQRHPDPAPPTPRAAARLAADASLWPAAVEEFLRHDGPVSNATWRFTTEPVKVGDVLIPEGEFVTISLAAAGRDPGPSPGPGPLRPRPAEHRRPGLRPRHPPLPGAPRWPGCRGRS